MTLPKRTTPQELEIYGSSATKLRAGYGRFVAIMGLFNILNVSRLVLLFCCLFPAWMAGCASWQNQLRLFPLVLLAGGLIVVSSFFNPNRGNRLALSLSLASLGLLAIVIVQLVPIDVDGWLGQRIPSITLQQSFEVPRDSALAEQKSELSAQVSQAGTLKRSISVDPSHSRAALFGLATAILAMLGGLHTGQLSKRWFVISCALIALNAFAVGLVGIVQRIVPFDWQLFDPIWGKPYSTFVSKNTTAAFLNVGIAATLSLIAYLQVNARKKVAGRPYRYPATDWLIKTRYSIEDSLTKISTPSIAAVVMLVILIAANLCSLSRGGSISMVMALVATVLIASVQRRRPFVILATLLVVILSSLLLVSVERFGLVAERLQTVSDAEVIASDARWTAWWFAVRSLRVFAFSGAGLGCFHFAYLPFQDVGTTSWFYHAENFFLQVFVDLGFGGLLILMAVVWLLAQSAIRLAKSSEKSLARCALPGLVFLLISQSLHGMVDFGMILPGVFIPSAVLAGQWAGIGAAVKRNSKSPRGIPGKSTPPESSHRVSFATRVGFSATLLVALAVSIGSYRSLELRASAESIEHQRIRLVRSKSPDLTQTETLLQQARQKLELFPDDAELNRLYAWLLTDRLEYRRRLVKSKLVSDKSILSLRTSFYIASMKRKVRLSDLDLSPTELVDLATIHEAWQKSHRAVTLDERSQWGLLQTDFVEPSITVSKSTLTNLSQLAMNRPELLRTAGLAALVYPGKESALELFSSLVRSEPTKFRDLLPILLENFTDQEIQQDCLPEDPFLLFEFASSPAVAARPNLEKLFLSKSKEKLLELSERDPQRFSMLAKMALKEGDVPGAIPLLESAVRLAPMDTAVRFQLAQCYQATGNTELAVEAVDACIRQNPNAAAYREFRSSITKQP